MNYQWTIEQHDIVFQGYFRIEKYKLTHEKYAGGWTGSFYREIFERGSAVAVLPYDPLNDKVILIEQFRSGAIGTLETPWMKEIVAGIIEAGESETEVAKRETVEEAGCEILELLPIANVWASPGTSEERDMLYCGRVDASGAGGVHGLDHEGEDIRVQTDMLNPAVTTAFKRADLERVEPAKTSMMPKGLVDILTVEEIRDLAAFLLSNGDRNHAMFKGKE